MKIRLILASSVLLPLSAQAHDGHGFISAQNVLHYIADPSHAAPLALAAVAVWWAARRSKARRS